MASNADFQALLDGELELEPCDAKPGSQAYSFDRMLHASLQLFHGDFDEAQKLLDQAELDQHGFLSGRLLKIWMEAESGDLGKAFKQIEQFRMPAKPGLFKSAAAKSLLMLDWQMAAHYLPVLRCYLITMLGSWPDAIMDQYHQARSQANKNGISELVLIHLDYLLRFAKARMTRSADKVLQTVSDWKLTCQDNTALGTGTEHALEAALALEAEMRFQEAVQHLDDALAHRPDNYELLLIKARILKLIGETRSCITVCNRLIDKYPQDFTGFCLRSNSYFMMGLFRPAMADARKAVELAPDNPNSLMARAFVQMQVGQYEKALADFESVLKTEPDRYDALRGQGKCQSMLGRDFAALESFNRLKRVYPDDPDLYYEMADVLFSAGYIDDCEKVCSQCIEQDRTYANAYVIMGMIALRKNDDEQAEKLLRTAIRLEPDNPFALNEYAYFVHLQGDEEQALELVDQALAEAPDYLDAVCNKGVILFFRSEFDQALDLFEQVLDQVPDHLSALVGKGNTLTQMFMFDEAQSCYDQVLQIDPNSADACHGKVTLYRMLGLDDEVRKWQEKAYKLDSEDDFLK